jgi:CcmD family protein
MFYLFMAYAVVWLFVTLYVFYLSRRQNSLEQEMMTLEEMVTDSSGTRND